MRFVCFAALMALLLAGCSAPAPTVVAPKPKSEQEELFDWFDGLGFTKALKGQFVEIQEQSDTGGRNQSVESNYGFIVADSGGTTTIEQLSLEEVTFVNGKDSGRPYATFTFKKPDLKPWLDNQINLIKKSLTPGSQVDYRKPDQQPFNAGIAAPGSTFLLARIADLHGSPDQCKELLALVRTDHFLKAPEKPRAVEMSPLAYTPRLKNAIAAALLNSAQTAFSNLTLTRKEILYRVNLVAKNCPPSDTQRAAGEMAKTLTKMVIEDDRRQPLSDDELKKLSPGDQSKELVWQLRNQTAHRVWDRGSMDVLGFGGGSDPKSPAGKLVALGVSAVPALIGSLDDRNYMRACEEGWRGQGHNVLRVQDAAIQILQKIAGRNFGPGWYGAQDNDDQVAAAKSEATKWYQEVGLIGEKGALVKTIESGSGTTQQAERLSTAYPDAALEAIRIGVSKTQDDYVRASLIRSLLKIHQPAVAEFARKEILNEGSSQCQVAAAEVLQETNPSQAGKLIATAWRKKKTVQDQEWEFVGFLSNSWTPESIAALFENMKARPVDLRMSILSGLQMEWVKDGNPRHKISDEDKKVIAGTLERALTQELQDRDARIGWSGSLGRYQYHDPRMCDMASYQLHEGWPDRYSFTPASSERERDAICLKDLNLWRKANGQPPLVNLWLKGGS